MELIIEQFSKCTVRHYELLLEAKPSKSMIDLYLPQSHCVEAKDGIRIIGVIILKLKEPNILEIVSIAVKEDIRGNGIGSLLIEYALEFAENYGVNSIEISVGSTNFKALYLYQKYGFRMKYIVRDFFTKQYDQKIMYNNIELKDLVRLEKNCVETH
ncbi:GNAT family N-acetyltransferase [Rossellomorea marisflavi]|uniref:GNAT family N-acetyltransferase n=1 Tax=Rossellomorea marisflavi TaxID=189381 RepID=A0A5D4RCE6_9BACI|nr:GNAT family N-acetyltransferase [Rossellomorea marisflavi]TYS48269.1 GNAT family N-acetyltransferase [Rossellomorea marisflavi]